MRKINLQLFASLDDLFEQEFGERGYDARAKYAKEVLGWDDYTGKAEENIEMKKILQSGGVSNNGGTSNANGGGTSNTNTQLPVTGNGVQLAQSALSKTFTPSASYQSAMAYTNDLLAQLSSGRTSYTDQIKGMMDQIMNREDFKYDADSDMLFQQYLNSSMATGKQAMQDTMGQAAALTGGYGSTYATSAGNQMYNAYIQDAYNNLPEYYQLALDAYNMEGQEMYNQLAMLNDADATEYGRLYNAWSANNTHAQQLYQQEYGQYSDEVKNAFDLAQFMNSNYWNEKQYNAKNGEGSDKTDYDDLTDEELRELQKIWYKYTNGVVDNEETEEDEVAAAEDKADAEITAKLKLWGKPNVDGDSLFALIGNYEPKLWEQNWTITADGDTENRWFFDGKDDHNDVYQYGDVTKTFDELVEMIEASDATPEEKQAFLDMLRTQSKQ